jgi:NCS2 family nucleobase:cation symporter-2
VSGLVVFMVGCSLVPLGATKFLGISYPNDPINLPSMLISLITLLTMIGVNIWSKSNLKLYSVLIGFILGYILSFIFGLINIVEFEKVLIQPLFAIPIPKGSFFDIKFDYSLIIPFIIVGLVGSLKTFGNLTTCQKINDKNWKEPDTKNIGNGLTADGLSIALSGLLGGVATDTSASNVGLSLATVSTSRVIAYSSGGIFIIIGFLPKIAALFSIMPYPVMGAIVVFVTSFMLLSGIQIITSNKINTRKIFIIGISFVFGISVDILPELYISVPSYLSPIFSSSLTLSTILAVILNQLFGEKQLSKLK